MGECAFDAGKKRCSALKSKECQGCRFYKTAEELIEGHEKAMNRLITLDRELLNHIKRKYYTTKHFKTEYEGIS